MAYKTQIAIKFEIADGKKRLMGDDYDLILETALQELAVTLGELNAKNIDIKHYRLSNEEVWEGEGVLSGVIEPPVEEPDWSGQEDQAEAARSRAGITDYTHIPASDDWKQSTVGTAQRIREHGGE